MKKIILIITYKDKGYPVNKIAHIGSYTLIWTHLEEFKCTKFIKSLQKSIKGAKVVEVVFVVGTRSSKTKGFVFEPAKKYITPEDFFNMLSNLSKALRNILILSCFGALAHHHITKFSEGCSITTISDYCCQTISSHIILDILLKEESLPKKNLLNYLLKRYFIEFNSSRFTPTVYQSFIKNNKPQLISLFNLVNTPYYPNLLYTLATTDDLKLFEEAFILTSSPLKEQFNSLIPNKVLYTDLIYHPYNYINYFTLITSFNKSDNLTALFIELARRRNFFIIKDPYDPMIQEYQKYINLAVERIDMINKERSHIPLFKGILKINSSLIKYLTCHVFINEFTDNLK